jgi:uncharacterized membrane protein
MSVLLNLFRSWQRAILLGSLCCNVLLATYIGVQWLRVEHSLVETFGPARLIARVAERLPSQDASILRQLYKSKEAELVAAQLEYVSSLGTPARLLTEQAIDPEALRLAIRETRKKRLRLGDLITETFLDAIVQMSPDGRRQLVSGIPKP